MSSEAERRAKAEALVKEMHAAGGLAPVDVDRFWADQEIAAKDPFGADIPQATVGGMGSHECVLSELGVELDWERTTHEAEWRMELAGEFLYNGAKVPLASEASA